jgi:hypothetical protein
MAYLHGAGSGPTDEMPDEISDMHLMKYPVSSGAVDRLSKSCVRLDSDSVTPSYGGWVGEQ